MVSAKQAGNVEVTFDSLMREDRVFAPPVEFAAKAAIGRAETHLEAKEYVRARLAAQEAKRHATAALNNAQRTEGAAPNAPPVR